MDFQYFIELFFGGLTRGSIYALIALGYTLVYGIIELINFAHGEIYMLGAFTALLVAGVLGIMGFPAGGILVVAALAAVVWSAAYGYTLEKVAYKPLRGAPRLSPLISAIGMSIFRFPYASMIGTLIGATALLPVVGAYLGAFVGAFMISTVNPIQALGFLVFIVVLQQLEGNLIYPRVVGSSVGLPGIWVLAAVTIGGGLNGVVGMLLAVPITATVYKLLQRDVRRRQEVSVKEENSTN